MLRLLVTALSGPLPILDSLYSPFLWGADRLGRSIELQGEKTPVSAALKAAGFDIISACHRGGFTYKWNAGCKIPKLQPAVRYIHTYLCIYMHNYRYLYRNQYVLFDSGCCVNGVLFLSA